MGKITLITKTAVLVYSKKTGEQQGVKEKITSCQTKPHLCNKPFFIEFNADEKVKMRFSRNRYLSDSTVVSVTSHIV